MEARYGIMRLVSNPARPGRYHIIRLFHNVSICGIKMQKSHSIGQWGIEQALRFVTKVVEKRTCKRCVQAGENLRPVLDRLARL